MFEDKARAEGFEIFKKGLVRRLSPTHYVAKAEAESAWQLVELKNGKWSCDCGTNECVHLYATRLHRSTSKLQPEQIDESNLKCRYCGSPDVAGCGFRYNARGIARRYRCNECQRKFSIAHIGQTSQAEPSSLIWLINEVGMLTTKLTDLLVELNSNIELLAFKNSPNTVETLNG
jgi:DNA-directed RNA polymerase subunit RPC12/RpoP